MNVPLLLCVVWESSEKTGGAENQPWLKKEKGIEKKTQPSDRDP